MYIWILLATIMVALSFLNLSPRADKDNTINEIKAAIVVNHIKAEHYAMLKTMECEFLMNNYSTPSDSNDSWLGDTYGTQQAIYIQACDEEKAIAFYNNQDGNWDSECGGHQFKLLNKTGVEYNNYYNNLPIGYSVSSDSYFGEVFHAVVCLNRPVEEIYVWVPLENEDGTPKLNEDGNQMQEKQIDNSAFSYVPCNEEGAYRYLVSFMQIPHRWLSKTNAEPLPDLLGLMSKQTGANGTYGWTDCRSGNCYLRGYSAKVGVLEINENTKQASPKYTSISTSASIWSDNKFSSTCKNSGTPCLLAYDKFPTVDRGGHCKKLFEGAVPAEGD